MCERDEVAEAVTVRTANGRCRARILHGHLRFRFPIPVPLRSDRGGGLPLRQRR